MELTLTQKRVLVALNAYPNHTDRQLADVVKIKRSTVTAARHFLQENKLYETYLFPNIQQFPVPLIILKYGDYGKLIPVNYQQRMKLLTPYLKIEENVFSLSSEFKGLSMIFAQQLYPLKEKLDGWNQSIQQIDSSIPINDLYLPLPMISDYKFMDVQRRLATLLGTEPLENKRKKMPHRKTLSSKEKMVLKQWFKQPRQTNEEISRTVDVSRAVIGSIKERLIQYGVVQIHNLPNWSAFGLELGVLLYVRSGQDSILQELAALSPIIFVIGSRYEGLLFAVFKNYQEYQMTLVPVLQRCKAAKKFIREPEELLFPLAETRFMIDAAPFVEKVLSS